MVMSQASALYVFCWIVINVDMQRPLLLCLGTKLPELPDYGYKLLLGKMN